MRHGPCKTFFSQLTHLQVADDSSMVPKQLLCGSLTIFPSGVEKGLGERSCEIIDEAISGAQNRCDDAEEQRW